MSVWGRARTFVAIGPSGWRRMAHTLMTARRIERSLAYEPLADTARRFGARLSFAPPCRPVEDIAPMTRAEQRAIGIALSTLRRAPVNGTCLRRALVMSDILRARDPLLRVGVAKRAGEVTAHAWVEIAGVAMDPMADVEYRALASVRGMEDE